MSVQVKFEFPDWKGKLRRAKRELDLLIAAEIQFNRGQLFDKEGSYNGHPKWASLKLREGQILSLTGTLRRSIAPQSADGRPGPDGIVVFGTDTVTVGTNVFYARMMNDGTTKMPEGVLRPVRARALRIPVGGGKFMFRKKVKIPARPFDTWTKEDENDLLESLTSKVTEVLNRDE